MRLLPLFAIAAVLAFAGCEAAPSGPTATPTAEQLALLTQPPPGPNEACMNALATGQLALVPRSGLGIVTGGVGEAIPVAWPNGYTARVVETTLVLFDHQGNALARLGDLIEMGGGFGDGVWYPCHGDLRVIN